MWTHELFGQLAGVIHIIAFVPYILSIVRGRTAPHRGSWFVWTLLGLALLLSYEAAGADETIWMSISLFVGPLIVFLLSLRFGIGGWDDIHDKYCLIGAVMGVAALMIFETPLIALTVSLLTDMFAALPTIRKSIVDPESEDALAWGLALVASGINILAIDEWTFAIAGYPVYAAVIFALIFYPLVQYQLRRLLHRRHVS